MPIDRALPAAHNPHSRFSLVVAIIGLAGVAAIFLPFTYGTSPLSLIFDGLWPFGVPAMLAILVTLGSFRWIVTGRFSRAERLSAYLAALVAAGCFLSMYLPDGNGDSAWGPSSFSDWFMFLVSWVGSAAGACLLWRNTRTGVPDAANGLAAMQVVYVIVATLSFVVFGKYGWQIGAYLVAVTTLVYLVQIVAVSMAAPGHPAPASK